MSKVLLVLNHPNYKDSFANKIVVDKLKSLIPDIEIDHIDALYPDGKIDVKAEQEKLLKANTIIFQFPIYWFKSPYFLSKYVEDVFTHGFAYGTNGFKLEGKKLIVSITLGGEEDEFKGNFTIERLMSPFEASAWYCKMKWGGFVYTLDIPFTIKDTPDLAKTKQAELEKHAEKLLTLIKG